MKPLIAMGVGWVLMSQNRKKFYHLGGMPFVCVKREQEAFKYLFTVFYGKGLVVCNEFSVQVGAAPLGLIRRI